MIIVTDEMDARPSRWAVVTGASKGIGRGIALALAAGAFDIVGVARDPGPLEETGIAVRSLGRAYRSYGVDLADPEGVEDLGSRILQDIGVVSVLVNNAGGGIGARPITETKDEEWRYILRLNVVAPYVLTRAFSEGMGSQGWGRVVNISSGAASYRVATEVTSAAYTAAKGAVLGLTRQTARLLAPHGITVNAILPGDVLTDAGGKLFDSLSPEDRDAVLSRIPRGQMTTPEEIGAAVLSLCQDHAASIVGVSLDVNGGAWMA